jgi:hypothetical protein
MPEGDFLHPCALVSLSICYHRTYFNRHPILASLSMNHIQWCWVLAVVVVVCFQSETQLLFFFSFVFSWFLSCRKHDNSVSVKEQMLDEYTLAVIDRSDPKFTGRWVGIGKFFIVCISPYCFSLCFFSIEYTPSTTLFYNFI